METKVCSGCKKELPLTEFYKDKYTKDGYTCYCKLCKNNRVKKWRYDNWEYCLGYQRTYMKEYRKNNPEKMRVKDRENAEKYKEYRHTYAKSYRECNKEYIKERNRKYYEENKERIKEYREENKEHHKEYMKKYCQENKERLKEQHKKYYHEHKDDIRKYQNERLKNDELYRITRYCRSRVYQFLKSKKFSKKSGTFNMVWGTPEQLLEHLHKTWYDNYGTEYNGEPVHIDHIIPLSSAETEEDIYKLCHYTNLQYLKPVDNLAKSDRIIQTI